jgi:reverse transcriptase-like protein
LNKKWFTKFDVRWEYNNICIKNGDQWNAVFKTNKGLYEPMVMFFGLTNLPVTFQMMMDDIFHSEVAQGYIIIYMDNILITIEGDLKDHQKYVAHVLNILLKHDLYLKLEKCSFYKKEVEYLGVIVGNGKVEMDPTKVQALTDWPQPTMLKQLCLFLGFGNYYKDFIVDYSRLARPLHELTKKSVKYFWGTL